MAAKARLLCFVGGLVLGAEGGAIVIRDDVDDAQYRVATSEFPALVDFPGEGHGVLIAPQWVLTAAHVLPRQTGNWQVVVDGKPRDVEGSIVHPGYRTLPQTLIDQAMASGEAMLIVVFLASSDDLALVRLKEPVADVVPLGLHLGDDAAGRIVQIVGKGATGTGATGHDPRGPNRTELRRAFNTVTSAYERWLCYVFDAPPAALPLEGVLGNGDSGGPMLVEADGQWRVVGLASWKVVQGHVMTTPPGRYGQIGCGVRLGHYAKWIEGMVGEHP